MKSIRLNPLLLVGGWLVLYGCMGSKSSMSVRVKNPASVSREQELVEIPLASFKGMHAERGDEGWIVLDRNGRRIPSQVTHDSLLLFPVTLSPLASISFWNSMPRVPFWSVRDTLSGSISVSMMFSKFSCVTAISP